MTKRVYHPHDTYDMERVQDALLNADHGNKQYTFYEQVCAFILAIACFLLCLIGVFK